MELQTIDIPRAGARETAAEYTRAARATKDAARRHEFEEIARAYRAAAKDDVALIALTPTITAGGTMQRTRCHHYWKSDERKMTERRIQYLLPRLAACRSSADFCFTLGVQKDGSVSFVDKQRPGDNYKVGRLLADRAFDALPDGFEPGAQIERWTRGSWTAMVPIVPPKHQPRLGASLAGYVTLFEVEDWQWKDAPLPPGDPALLRHLGGDIYAVLATWDLTPLERLVLSGRRPEA